MDGANNTNNRFLSRTHNILQPAAGPPSPTLTQQLQIDEDGRQK